MLTNSEVTARGGIVVGRALVDPEHLLGDFVSFNR